MVLAYAITSYSVQGITKERVIIDYSSNQAKHALYYVLFSRVKTLNGISIKDLKMNMSYVNLGFMKNIIIWRQDQHTNLTTHIFLTLTFIIQLQKKYPWRK